MSAAPAEATAPAEVKIKVEHMTAAALGRDQRSRQLDVGKVQKIWEKRGDEGLFRSEEKESIDEPQPNFPEIESTLHNIADVTRREELMKKIKIMQEIVEEKPPGTLSGGTGDEQVQAVGPILANMPAMVASVAQEMGVSAEQAKDLLRGSTTALTRTSALGTIIERRILKDEKFVALLRKNIGSNLSKDDNLISLESQIESDTAKYNAEKARIDAERAHYVNGTTGVVDMAQNLMARSPAVYDYVIRNGTRFSNIQALFADERLAGDGLMRDNGLKTGDVNNYQTDVLSAVRGISGVPSTFDQNTDIRTLYNTKAVSGFPIATLVTPEEASRIQRMQKAWKDAEQLKNYYSYNPNIDDAIHLINQYNVYLKTTKPTLDNDESANNTLKTTNEHNKLKRDKQVNTLAQRVDRMMNKSVKDYYNGVLLSQAQSIAQYEADQVADDKAEAEKLKGTREEKMGVLLKEYLLKTYLKYEGKDGEANGWEDDDLKHFMKEGITGSSPSRMGKDLLRRIYSHRSSLPPDYRKEIDALFKDMGAGTNGVTARQIIDGMSDASSKKWAEDYAPKVMAFAEQRGYYFSPKLSKPQMQYMIETYGDEFFTNVLTNLEKYKGDLAKMDNNGKEGYLQFMDKGALKRRKIQEFLVGKNWDEGQGKLWKVVKALAAAWFLGGGAAGMYRGGFNLFNLGSYPTAFKAGTDIALKTGEQLVNATTGVISTASMASAAAIQGITGVAIPKGGIIPLTQKVNTTGKPIITGGVQKLAQMAQDSLNTVVAPVPPTP